MPTQSKKTQSGLFYAFGSKPVLFAMCLMAACTFFLFYINYQREKERALESIQGKFSERFSALDRTVSSAEASVNLIKNWAENYLSTDQGQISPAPMLKMLHYQGKGDYFELGRNEKQSSSATSGNIMGVGPMTGRSHLFEKELSLAADILPLLRATVEESAVILQNYYFSNLKISSTYPYVPVNIIIEGAAPGGTLKDALDIFYKPHAGLHANPERKGYWTDVCGQKTL